MRDPVLNSMFRSGLVETKGVWPSFPVWSPPWLYASSVKNKRVMIQINADFQKIKDYFLADMPWFMKNTDRIVGGQDAPSMASV